METCGNDVAETITLTPNWDGVRAFVLELAKTDLRTALNTAYHMGNEAPTLRAICEAAGLDS